MVMELLQILRRILFINSVLQVILNFVDYGMDVGKAVESPRMDHQWLPDRISHESWGFSKDSIDLLNGMGHTTSSRGTQGSVMAIYIDHEEGLLHGAADSRGYDSRGVGN